MLFRSDDRVFKCTDIGTRTVIAIRVDQVEKTTATGDSARTSVLSGEEAAREGWFNGPPYAVAEFVFGEYDLEGCEPFAVD